MKLADLSETEILTQLERLRVQEHLLYSEKMLLTAEIQSRQTKVKGDLLERMLSSPINEYFSLTMTRNFDFKIRYPEGDFLLDGAEEFYYQVVATFSRSGIAKFRDQEYLITLDGGEGLLIEPQNHAAWLILLPLLPPANAIFIHNVVSFYMENLAAYVATFIKDDDEG